MCGVTGILSLNDNCCLDADYLHLMTSKLAHRGPDSGGIWVEDNGVVGFGHRRLAILDRSESGHQPMLSLDNRFVITFNGEIYNHQALRSDLLGHHWRGNSDTETLLACVQHWGIYETLNRIAGMYAFALFDRHEERLYLVRDRFGEKPLYYTKIRKGEEHFLLFASELKAIKEHPTFKAEIDLSTVATFLEFSYVPAPHSIYCDVAKLEAGSVMVFDRRTKDVRKIRYWKSEGIYKQCLSSNETLNGDSQSLIDGLDKVLLRVIKEQMLADVPLGAFLSGGIDSTIIVAMMQAQSTSNVKTFTIGYDERAYSEAEHAKKVAAYLGTEHTELYVDDSVAKALIPKLPLIYDEPFADPSQLPTFLVSQLASTSVRVALSGDGGDEMFAGYNRYWMANQYWKKLKLLPAPLLRLLSQAMTILPEHIWDHAAGFLPFTSIGFKIHKAARVINSKDVVELYLSLISNWPNDHGLVKGAHPHKTLVRKFVDDEELNHIHRMIILDLLTYLPDDILTKVDRAAMSCSLETRAPFLDHRVASYAWSVPLEYKMHGTKSKWLLRELLYRYVPRKLVDRPKMGFGFPIDVWLRGGLRDWAEDLLSPRRISEDGILNPQPIRKAWKQHLSGKYNWANKLWAVLMFQAWLHQEREG